MKTMFATLSALAIITAIPAAGSAATTTTDQHAAAKADYYFKKIDSNNDGKISIQEHEKFGDNMFSEADTNKDNVISKEELTAAKKQEMDEYKAAKGNM